MPLPTLLTTATTLLVRQKRELAELAGFETRNKYSIETDGGAQVAFAAEQQKGFFGFLLRQIVGHWRSFSITFFDPARQPIFEAVHPFRWFFQRLEVHVGGRLMGALQQRWAFFSKRFDVQGGDGRVLLTVSSPFFRPWTFKFEREGRELARIEKKWAGILSEAFTDKDVFRVQLGAGLGETERTLVLAAAIFVDLQYFERKAQ